MIFEIFLILLVKIYQYTLSPILPNSCRYNPSCSVYSIQALKKHGPFKGFYYSVKRVFSGIRATGRLHLGNYLGAVKGFLELEKTGKYETVYCNT